MGQPIEITGTTTIDDVVLFHTDRSITGQDGVAFADRHDAEGHGGFPGRLAAAIAAADGAVDHVYIASNEVVVRRSGGWDDTATSAIGEVIRRFFLFYRSA